MLFRSGTIAPHAPDHRGAQPPAPHGLYGAQGHKESETTATIERSYFSFSLIIDTQKVPMTSIAPAAIIMWLCTLPSRCWGWANYPRDSVP